MPEDQRIWRKKRTCLRVTDEFLLREARARNDNFEYDPDRRKAIAIQKLDEQAKQQMKIQSRIRFMKTSASKRRTDERATTHQRRIDERAQLHRQRLGLSLQEAPGTPSPPLRVPQSNIPRTPLSPLSDQDM